MAAIDIHDDSIRVRLTTIEKLFALRGDVTVPRDSIQSVEHLDEGLDGVTGFRAPGLALPGRIKIGTWRRKGGKELVVVRRSEPAVRLTLRDQPWQALVVGTRDAAAVAATLA